MPRMHFEQTSETTATTSGDGERNVKTAYAENICSGAKLMSFQLKKIHGNFKNSSTEGELEALEMAKLSESDKQFLSKREVTAKKSYIICSTCK
uniref:Uncharacterized protein n=1 Tax=Glossina palpalis gambiensis TaxID=67801 RepID=A0A1B0B2T9_9MUSC